MYRSGYKILLKCYDVEQESVHYTLPVFSYHLGLGSECIYMYARGMNRYLPVIFVERGVLLVKKPSLGIAIPDG